MNYLTYLNINNFKSIENLELQDLSNINIIVGINNSGKTSLLEAISILSNLNSMKSIFNNVSKRGYYYPSNFELFLDIFPKKQGDYKNINIKSTIKNCTREMNIDGSIELNYQDSKGKSFVGNIVVKEEEKTVINKEIIVEEGKNIKYISDFDVINIVYVTPYDYCREDLVENTIRNINNYDRSKIVELLNIFDVNILDFEVPKTNEMKPIYIHHKKFGRVPLFSFGDGLKKVFTLGLAVVNAREGIILIDEIEIAIHKTMINKVFRWIVDTTKEYKVQIICTTHSLEVIDGMILASKEDVDSLSCFRIEMDEEDAYYTKFSGDRLKNIRTLLGQDVR